jgi:hypothetical protein
MQTVQFSSTSAITPRERGGRSGSTSGYCLVCDRRVIVFSVTAKPLTSPLPGNESTGYILLHFRDLGSAPWTSIATVGAVETFYDVVRVIFIISAFFGALFAPGVLVMSVVGLFDSWRGWVLRRVPVRTIGQLLGAKTRPRRVAVRATAVAGPAGEQHSPHSGTPCLWYRLTLRRIDNVKTDSGFASRHVTVWSEVSGDTVWFDDGTGTVPVDVSLLENPLLDGRSGAVERHVVTDLDLPVGSGLASVVRRAERERNTEGFDLVEELVRPGVEVTLFSRPATRDGHLVLARTGGPRAGVTELTPTEVIDHHSGETRELWWTVRLITIIGVAAYLCGVGGVKLTDLIR